MLQQDSITQAAATLQSADTATTSPAPRTPYEVLRQLPRDATLAQQDSAIQAAFQPAEIHWSNRPDTLHMPGYDAGRNMLEVEIPQYSRTEFFSKDTLFSHEVERGRMGVAGDPVPYSIAGDNLITSLLLLCFISAVIAFANARRFIVRQIKTFFYLPHEGTTEMSETSSEMRFQAFLVLLTSLLLALLYYFYTIHYKADTFILSSQYQLIAIFLAVMVAYFLMKGLFYIMVGSVFFERKQNVRWLKSLIFITSLEGVLLFPAVVLQAYFDLPIQNAIIYFIIVLILTKLLTFYKSFVIFFRGSIVYLQIILYFCALEMVPLVALWGVLDILVEELKINY